MDRHWNSYPMILYRWNLMKMNTMIFASPEISQSVIFEFFVVKMPALKKLSRGHQWSYKSTFYDWLKVVWLQLPVHPP